MIMITLYTQSGVQFRGKASPASVQVVQPCSLIAGDGLSPLIRSHAEDSNKIIWSLLGYIADEEGVCG